MKSCPKCNHKFNFLSRAKSISTSLIECEHCNNKYNFKYPSIVLFINIFLTYEASVIINSLFPLTIFLLALIRIIILALIISFSVYFISSYFVNYNDIN